MNRLGSCAIVVLVAACTRPNAGFEGGEASTADEQGEVGQEGEGTTTADGGTTRGSADTTDTRATTVEGTTQSVMTGPDDTSAMDTSIVTEGPLDTGICGLEFADIYPLVPQPSFPDLFGGQCPGFESLTIGMHVQAAGIVAGLSCSDMCNCEGAPEITVDFGSAPLPPLPDCFRLQFQLDTVTCDVLDYSITQSGAVAPLFTASNASLVAGVLAFVPDVAPTFECNESCLPPSGYYALLQANTAIPVLPDAVPVELMGGLETYLVVNDRSGVDPDCNQVVRWHATQVP